MMRTDGPRVAGRARVWLVSVLLALPAAWPYAVHYLDTSHGQPTGFIALDMPVYMANAREHFDRLGVTYGNPFSPSYDTPRIYFQPMTLLLGIVWAVTGLDPGLVFVLFGAAAAVLCVRAAIALYARVIPLHGRAAWSGLVTFVWGGGVIALAGIAYNGITGSSGSLFRFDVDDGWWFLNLGRNLIFPTEALYHAVFLGCIATILTRRFGLALGLAALASISHPFTGVQLLLILTTWGFAERVFLRSAAVPAAFAIGCGVLLAAHLGYYLLFLNLFAEHRSLAERWALPWVYHARHFVPAYLLVAGLATWGMRRIDHARTVLSSPANRLFLMWFIVSFALANHEFAMRPVQPAHFTRGYVWMPLFLLGAPVLAKLLTGLWSSHRRVLGPAAAVALVVLFVSDNALWLATRTAPLGIYRTADQRDLLQWLDDRELRDAVVLARGNRVGFLATVYTPLRAWHSHGFNTPFRNDRVREAREFFGDGSFIDAWRDTRLLIVYDAADGVEPGSNLPPDVSGATRFRNASYTVLELTPGPSSPRTEPEPSPDPDIDQGAGA